MNLNWVLVSILFLLSFTGCYSPNPPTPPGKLDNPYIQKLLARYENYLETEIRANKTPGAAVIIIEDTTILYQRGFGLRAAGLPDTVDVNTVFRIGSLSKGFAGVLTEMLASDSLIDWDDKVVDYLPGFKLNSNRQTREVNLWHLLSHTTGLPYHSFTNLIEYGEDLIKIAPKFAKIRLIGKEGEIYSYQNASFGLIDPVVEAATGCNFEYHLKERIFLPLGMKTASSSFEAIVGCENVAQPHQLVGEQFLPIPITEKYYNAVAAGGINASISDMAEWLQLLLGNRPQIISEKSLNFVFDPVVDANIDNRYFRRWPSVQSTFYAKGWRLLNYGGRPLVYHGGFVNGFRGELAVDREQKTAICVLVNAPAEWVNDCIPVFLDMYTAQIDSIRHWQNQIDSIFMAR